MIFAAGVGSRLAPLTNYKPKALVKINGITLLENAILKLRDAGCTRIVVNVHHFADLVDEFLKEKDFFKMDIVVSDERKELLDTGGGLKKAIPLFKKNKPIVIYNVDIISDIDLKEMVNQHINSDAVATLAVKARDSSRGLLIDKNGRVRGKINKDKGTVAFTSFEEANMYIIPFSGIHVINYEFLGMIEEVGKFSIIESYLQNARKNKIMTYRHDDDAWMDCGKYEEVKDIAS